MQFYYHSDHLGSASFLTDRDGYETQQLVYLPFGEDWVDMKYNTSQYDTPYKFNGKEKDEETGYNNYGARYYYDWASIWLSVDPMSDKYPSTSSYAYCRNNPIMLVDPDGMDDDGWEINHQSKTVKKVSDEGGENKQIIKSSNGFMLTKNQSTKDFVSECSKDGYTVNNDIKNTSTEVGSQISDVATSFMTELKNNEFANKYVKNTGKTIGRLAGIIGYANTAIDTYDAYKNNNPGFKRNYEISKALFPALVGAVAGGVAGGLAVPGVIVFEKGANWMSRVHSDIEQWMNQLPQQIINSY